MRFLLGAGEAGFFPDVAFYLGTWFPAHYRTRVIAWFMVAIPISSVVGSPISGLLLQMHGVRGLAGWQWLFVLEGVPAVLVGFAILWQIVDRPEDATWLDQRERQIVHERIASERRERAVHRLLPVLKDPRVLILGAVQFGFLVGSYGVGIWLPQIIKAGNLSNVEIGFVTSACYLLASIGMIAWASHVDRGGNKVNNLAIACLVSALDFLFAIYSTAFWMSLSGITVSLIGINAARGIFFTIPLRFLTGMAAAGGLAFINSVGTAGGFVGPTIMGWLVDRTGSFSAGLATMAGFLLLAATMAASLRLFVAQD
jgi:MFS family permease